MEVEIWNAEALVERFGAWPSFHDAEVLGLRLDSGQRSNAVPSLELDVHLFTAGDQAADGSIEWTTHTLATLLFKRIEQVALDGFGPQNVLFDLDLQRVVGGPVPNRIAVELQSSNGLAGSFTCESVTVLAATPHDPGPHSAARRPS
jgi:Immunity protein 50